MTHLPRILLATAFVALAACSPSTDRAADAADAKVANAEAAPAPGMDGTTPSEAEVAAADAAANAAGAAAAAIDAASDPVQEAYDEGRADAEAELTD